MKKTPCVIYQFVLLVVVLGLCGCQGADKGSIKVPATTQWTDSGIDVCKGQAISVHATGDVYVNKKIQSGPSGIDDTRVKPLTKLVLRTYNVTSKAKHGALIAKIGKNGKPFPVGAQHEVKADSKGRLYLGLNDKDLGNNQGHYLAKITVK
ncbi:MAG: hypothetical protein IMF18_01505 [Proteobacteria bacterium]|nr:hypothetical protein [Pseudomonadota bacterium]